MTAPEVFQVRDGDGWEVYIGNASGGWRLVSSGGGTAVVDTLPDGAEAMVEKADPSSPEALQAAIDACEYVNERTKNSVDQAITRDAVFVLKFWVERERALRAATAADAEVEELAQALHAVDIGGRWDWVPGPGQDMWRDRARRLIADGWTRGDRRG